MIKNKTQKDSNPTAVEAASAKRKQQERFPRSVRRKG